MPTPLGHALGGLTAGCAVETLAAGLSRIGGRHYRALSAGGSRALWFALLGVLADADLLVGAHSTYTHSIGAAALIGVAAFALVSGGRWISSLAAAAAYASHILLDWLGSDRSLPIGIMALWPLSDAHCQSDLHWFLGAQREYWLDGFWSRNLMAVAREVILLGPLAAAAWWVRQRRTR